MFHSEKIEWHSSFPVHIFRVSERVYILEKMRYELRRDGGTGKGTKESTEEALPRKDWFFTRVHARAWADLLQHICTNYPKDCEEI